MAGTREQSKKNLKRIQDAVAAGGYGPVAATNSQKQNRPNPANPTAFAKQTMGVSQDRVQQEQEFGMYRGRKAYQKGNK